MTTLSQQWWEHRQQTHRDDESERLGDLLAAENDRLRAALLGAPNREIPSCGLGLTKIDAWITALNEVERFTRAALNGEAGA